jgi:hypothetical protein
MALLKRKFYDVNGWHRRLRRCHPPEAAATEKGQDMSCTEKELAERYETPLPALTESVTTLEEWINAHLERMGFSW